MNPSHIAHNHCQSMNNPNQQNHQFYPTQTFNINGLMMPEASPAINQKQGFQTEMSSQGYQYHPALQQTQNFYIGMNQIIPTNSSEAQNLANDLFNMSANISNTINQLKSQPKQKRKIQTAGGINFNQTQNIGQPDSGLQMNFNNTQQDFIQRCFGNQRSPTNERQEAFHQMMIQTNNMRNQNKPKSAQGHRMVNNQSKFSLALTPSVFIDRFKNMNTSSRFVGQNSTIIHHSRHSGYNNTNVQPLKVFQGNSQKGGWMDQSIQSNQNNNANNNRNEPKYFY